MRDRVVFVAQSEIERQVRSDPEIVLRIALKKRPAVPDHSFSLKISGGVGLVIDEVVVRRVGDRRRRQRIAGVIQLDAADVDSELQRVTAADHRQVIDIGESRADFGIERGVADAVEGRNAGGYRRGPISPVVIVGAIQPELDFVDCGRRKDALVLQNEVGGNVRNHVVASQRVRRIIDISVVDVVADEGRVVVVEAVVEAGHAGIFADGVGGDFRHLVGDAVHRCSGQADKRRGSV